jgi:hypothetical protein
MKHIKFKHFNSAKNESNSKPTKAKERLRSLSSEVKKLRRRRLLVITLVIFTLTSGIYLILSHASKSPGTGNSQTRN